MGVGPGLFTTDWSLNKSFRFGNGMRLEVEVQMFNVTNTQNFGTPAANLWQNANTRRVATAGYITRTVTDARQMQFGIRFVF